MCSKVKKVQQVLPKKAQKAFSWVDPFSGCAIHVHHYSDVIMGAMASEITTLAIVYSTVYSVADQRKHESSASLAFVRGIHQGPLNSPHKWPVTRKMFPFDDVIMYLLSGFYAYTQEHANKFRKEGLFKVELGFRTMVMLFKAEHVEVSFWPACPQGD